MWIDTHLHLDASEYDPDRADVVQAARAAGVEQFVLPAVHRANFNIVRDLAHATPGAVYCLGIHPMFTGRSQLADLQTLETTVLENLADPKFAGIGEIGLDGFVPDLDWDTQLAFFHAQLKLASRLKLPVVMHVRKAQDAVLAGLRRFKPPSGIAHAFNGSMQQAEQFLALNIKLGFGGACTFTRALQLRRLASNLPPHAMVLETDGPDIAPEWINRQRNAPQHLARIAEIIAELRGIHVDELARQTGQNARQALPALAITAQSISTPIPG